jgi:hypothetical protein
MARLQLQDVTRQEMRCCGDVKMREAEDSSAPPLTQSNLASQWPGASVAQVMPLQPLALPPLAAAQFLSISKRSLSRLIAAGKIVARKEGTRTLVDVESLKGYYERLPMKRSR